MDYYMPSYYGLVMMAIGTVALPVHLTGYRERGVLRRFRASSFSVWSVLGSQTMVSFIIAIIGSVLVTILGIVTYHPHMPANVPELIAAVRAGRGMFYLFRVFPRRCFTLHPFRPGHRADSLLRDDDTGRGGTAAGSP